MDYHLEDLGTHFQFSPGSCPWNWSKADIDNERGGGMNKGMASAEMGGGFGGL